MALIEIIRNRWGWWFSLIFHGELLVITRWYTYLKTHTIRSIICNPSIRWMFSLARRISLLSWVSASACWTCAPSSPGWTRAVQRATLWFQVTIQKAKAGIKDDKRWYPLVIQHSCIEIVWNRLKYRVDFAINMVISHSFLFYVSQIKRHSPRTVQKKHEAHGRAGRSSLSEVRHGGAILPFVESEFPFFMWGILGKLRPEKLEQPGLCEMSGLTFLACFMVRI